MSYNIINEVESRMRSTLSDNQMADLHNTLISCITGSVLDGGSVHGQNLIVSFISSKKVEGCSDRTLRYYRYILETVMKHIGKPARTVTTDDIRRYLAQYQGENRISNTTLDNVRRVLSSFFSWLEDEDIIFKSPVKRIKKVRTPKTVKGTYSDETLEILRDRCGNIRDLALLDILISTGMRVGELVNLDISDIDLQNRECIVLGKGDKERMVYFDARTKVHLSNYIRSRTDSDPALFVSLLEPHRRLGISGVETRIKNIAGDLDIGKVHPHKFRRTLATMAIYKGMPIEQVQTLLGHSKIDTTMEYAIVNQNNVKESHKRFIS